MSFLFSALFNHIGFDFEIMKHTMIWYSKKEKWKKGPNLPEWLLEIKDFCATSLNSTSVAIYGGVGFEKETSTNFMTIYHFHLKLWIKLPGLEIDPKFIFRECSLSSIFSKKSNGPTIYAFMSNSTVFDTYIDRHMSPYIYYIPM